MWTWEGISRLCNRNNAMYLLTALQCSLTFENSQILNALLYKQHEIGHSPWFGKHFYDLFIYLFIYLFAYFFSCTEQNETQYKPVKYFTERICCD